jgi:hypothetical protein
MAVNVNDQIRETVALLQEMLRDLEGSHLHIGGPFEGRTEAKIADLRRQIAQYQSILDKKQA